MTWSKFMVCLDLSVCDQSLVNYAVSLAEHLQDVQSVTLFHNIRFDFEGVASSFSTDDIKRLIIKIKRRITDRFGPQLSDRKISFDVVVTDENSTTEAILLQARARNSNVILMGKKTNAEGRGIIPQKILATDRQMLPLLLIPSQVKFRAERLVAAVDLSSATEKVVKTVTMLGRASAERVALLHVYKVPVNYFPYIEKPTDKLDENLKQRAVKQMKEFQTKLGIPVQDKWTIAVRKSMSISNAILSFTEEQSADLLIIGRLGKTNLLGNSVGGVARTLVVTSLPAPICIV